MKRPFDRTRDVSKLVGCKVRNVFYKWDIYLRHLGKIPDGACVLDFGAGSLRETYDLTLRGFRVTAVDMNMEVRQQYLADYDWKNLPRPTLLADLPDEGQFCLITAFDVIEHLPDPAPELMRLSRILAPGGMIFVTVPNRWTLNEYLTRIRGPKGLTPGEAHFQFKSPREWRSFFAECGFKVIDHDMGIGPIVNTTHTIAHHTRLDVLHRPVAKLLDTLDRLLRPVTYSFYGWNLLVLAK